jgi:hypothetical protein
MVFKPLSNCVLGSKKASTPVASNLAALLGYFSVFFVTFDL